MRDVGRRGRSGDHRPAGQLDAGVAPGAVSSPVLCAEFPPSRAPGDGWWNASPATADGAVVRDSSDWPDPRPREHPRVVLVDVDEGVVLSAWDRVACDDDIPGYVPPAPGPGWEPGTIVVLDADTGELLDSMTGPLTSAG